jgi:hypothetical protein
VLPAFRVPSRWVAMIMTVVLPLAALGLQGTYEAVRSRTSASRFRTIAPLAIVAVAMAVSFAELTIPPARNLAHAAPTPPEYNAIARVPEGVLAEYPLRSSDLYGFWQREHERPLLDGAPDGTYANEVMRSVADPSSPGTAAKLALLGVTAIITRKDALEFGDTGQSQDDARRTWGTGYALLGRYGGGTSAWRVTAPRAPALPTLPSASFLPPGLDDDGLMTHELTGQTGRIELLSATPQVVRLTFDAFPRGNTNQVAISGGTGTTSFRVDGKTRISTLVKLPKGRSRLDLRIEPAQEPGEFPLAVTSPWTEPGSGAAALTAAAMASGSPRIRLPPPGSS